MLRVIASAKNTARANAQTTGVGVTHGFTLANGDVLYAILGQGDDPGDGWADSASAWTQLANAATSTGNDRAMGVMRKVISNAAGEPAAYTFTRPGNNATDILAAIVVQVRGANTATPEDQITAIDAGGSDDFTPDSVNITTTTAGALLLVAHLASGAAGAYSGANVRTAGAPATPTGLSVVNSAVYDDGSNTFALFLEVAALADSGAAGAKSVGAWTGTPDDSTSEYYTVAIAVRLGTEVFSATATGGVAGAGAALAVVTGLPPVSGGTEASGAATVLYEHATYPPDPLAKSGTDLVWLRRRYLGAVRLAAAGTEPQTYTHTASGGAIAAGESAVVLGAVPSVAGGTAASGVGGQDLSAAVPAAGGVVTSGAGGQAAGATVVGAGGGAADGSSSIGVLVVEQGSGGGAASGAPAQAITVAAVAAGGGTAAGVAGSAQVWTVQTVGGPVTAGAAAVGVDGVVTGSDGAAVGGAAGQAVSVCPGVEGGGVLAGAAATELVPATAVYVYTAVGGIEASGSSSSGLQAAVAASGGADLSGAATEEYVAAAAGYTHTASGGTTGAGDAGVAWVAAVAGTGSAALAGVALHTVGAAPTTVGGMEASGTAGLALVAIATADGGAAAAGAVGVSGSSIQVGAGGAAGAGSGAAILEVSVPAAGGGATGGTATAGYVPAAQTQTYLYSATGGAVLLGAAAVGVAVGVVAVGGATLTGGAYAVLVEAGGLPVPPSVSRPSGGGGAAVVPRRARPAVPAPGREEEVALLVLGMW